MSKNSKPEETANEVTDGLPPMAPKPGDMMLLYWWVDGTMSKFMVEVAHGLPAGHFHLTVYRMRDDAPDGVQLVQVDTVKGPKTLSKTVVGIAEKLSPGAGSYMWLPTAVPGGEPTAKHPHLAELS